MLKPMFLGLLLFALSSGACAKGPATQAGIPSVIDGDTLDLHGNRIRLWGVDAPESSQLCTAPDGRRWRCGATSANELSRHIGGRTVTCQTRDVDRYGRTVASCSVAGADIGDWLVRNGWALAFRRYSKMTYVAAETFAIEQRNGMHNSQFETPWDYRKNKAAARKKPFGSNR